MERSITLEQRLAVEAERDRVAGAADGLAQAPALAAQLLQARGELEGHAVELAAELRELVVALHRDRGAEVAARDPPGGGEQVGDLGLERARDREGEQTRDEQEGEQQAADQQPVVQDRGGHALGVVEHREAQPPAGEVGRAEGRGAVVDSVERELAAGGERPLACGRNGGGQRAAVALDGHVEAADAGDERRQLASAVDRDLKPAQACAGESDQVVDGGRDGVGVADVDRGPVAAEDDDALGAGAREQLPSAGTHRGGVAGAQGDRERAIRSHRSGDGGGVARRLGVEPRRDRPALGHARVGLAGLAVGDEVEEHAADRKQRHDDDKHEEEAQTGPEAHARWSDAGEENPGRRLHLALPRGDG